MKIVGCWFVWCWLTRIPTLSTAKPVLIHTPCIWITKVIWVRHKTLICHMHISMAFLLLYDIGFWGNSYIYIYIISNSHFQKKSYLKDLIFSRRDMYLVYHVQKVTASFDRRVSRKHEHDIQWNTAMVDYFPPPW